MTIQVLVSTMHQTDHSLLERMNIQCDAIVVNQCDINRFEEFDYRGHHIQFLSLNERGVGLSRNTALMRSTADIVLFADDDVVYEDGYAQAVLQAFEDNKKCQLMVFNLISQNPQRPEYIITNKHRLHRFNSLRYGAFRIAVRRSAALYNNIFFTLLFGGGAPYSAGEDNMFIVDFLKKRNPAYAIPLNIGTVKQEESTWFCGFTRKYFEDKGALLYLLYGNVAYVLASILIWKNRAIYYPQYTFKSMIGYVFKGIMNIKSKAK